jgi:hypothetical protein
MTTTTERRRSVSEGIATKAPCRVATTGNITLSGEQTIDGIAAVADDRVLVRAQTDATENGIYDVSTGNWTRARDCDGAYDLVQGTKVFVVLGSTYARTEFYVDTTGPITVGDDEIEFGVTYPGGASIPALTSGQLLVGQAVGDPLGKTVSGDLTMAASGAASISARAVTAAKLFAMSTARILGRVTGGAGDVEELTLTQVLDLITGASHGDILFRGATDWQTLQAGVSASDLFLKTGGPGADPEWAVVTVVDQMVPATQAEIETGVDVAAAITPGRAQYHKSACKAWVKFRADGSIQASYNVASISKTGVGDFTVNFTTALSSGEMCVVITAGKTDSPSSDGVRASLLTLGTSGVRLELRASSSTLVDVGSTTGTNAVCVAVFGDLP